MKADAERVFQAILKKPGAGSKYLREGAGLRLGPTALGDALRVLVDDARIANRPTLHGTREDAHYFVAATAQPEAVSP